jgi:hypothetical protein
VVGSHISGVESSDSAPKVLVGYYICRLHIVTYNVSVLNAYYSL